MSNLVAIIGAGVAGLAAAHTLHAAGVACVVLEATGRVGGRAHTLFPAALGGALFERGAIWLHAADRNPLVPIARDAGEKLTDADTLRERHVHQGLAPVSDAEQMALRATWTAFERDADALLATSEDQPFSAVAAGRPDDPWAPTVEAFEGPVIDVADAATLSLRDWRTNQLDGANLIVAGGVGSFIERRLPFAGLDLRLNTPVNAIVPDRAGIVSIETDRGTLRASGAIITVSTGVLARGTLRLPGLPDRVRAALDALPMGLAVKVALRAAPGQRLGYPKPASLFGQLSRPGAPFMVFNLWPGHTDHVVGWVGGVAAWALQAEGDAAAEAFFRDHLSALLGASVVDRTFPQETGRVVTDWGHDPFTLGAYSYVRPGHAAARAALGVPWADGRVVIAGEAAATDGLAGTLGGAWGTGVRAAAGFL